MDMMWDDIGVIRDATSIQRGLEPVSTSSRRNLRRSASLTTNLAFNLTWHDWLNLKKPGRHLKSHRASSACTRENSRGAHYREDFPDTGDLDSSYFTVAQRMSDEVKVEREDVVFSHVRPGETLLKDGEARSLVEAAE